MSDALATAVTDLAAAIRELARAVEGRRDSPTAQPSAVVDRNASVVAAAAAALVPELALASPAEPAVGSPADDPLVVASGLLTELFRLAVGPDSEDAFERFVALYHTERITPPRAIPTLREFAWRSVRRRAVDYLATPGDPSSFALARSERTPGTPAVRVFVAARGRSPTPVAFRPDGERGGRLRITDSSL